MATRQSQETKNELFKKDISQILEKVTNIETQLEHKYVVATEFDTLKKYVDEKCVTQDQFWPVKALMYGMVSLALTAVVLGVLTLVIKQGL